MTIFQRSRTIFIVFLLALLIALTQADLQTVASEEVLGSKVAQVIQDGKAFIKENQEVGKDVVQAHKQILDEKQRLAVQVIDLVEDKLKTAQDLFSGYFPDNDFPFLQQIVDTLDEYKNLAAMTFGLIATAFQMIFGGGFRYITSKVKHLSDHKLKIQAGFDLQYEIMRRNLLGNSQQYDYYLSPSFQSLGSFLDINDDREIKLILGCNGLGISVAVKQWIKNASMTSDTPIDVLYYDLKAPLIKSKSNQDAYHLQNLSSIIYSLIYKEDRNFILRLVKGIYENVLNIINKIIAFTTRNPIVMPIMILLYWFISTLFYLIVIYYLSWIVGIFLRYFYRELKRLMSQAMGMIEGLFKKKQISSKRNDGGKKLKIIIGNIHFLQSQFKTRYEAQQLRKVDESFNKIPSPPTVPDPTSTLSKHRQLFQNNLITLVNNMSALQFKSRGEIQIILIVANSEFYYNCLQKLNFSEGNVFKVKRMAQLPFADTIFLIKRRTVNPDTLKYVKNTINENRVAVYARQAYAVAEKLALFHNNSKEIVKLLKEVNLQCQAFDPQLLTKDVQRIDIQASVVRTSMSQIVRYGEILKQFVDVKKSRGPQSPRTYEDFIGLFLGCLHKKILFFVNRREHFNRQCEQLYLTFLKQLNNNANIDMISTISPFNKRYLFQRANNLYQLKNDVKLIVLKWDSLISYIQSDNNWEESLRDEFVYNYIESCKHTENMVNVNQGSSQHARLVTEAKLFFGQITIELTNKEILFQHVFYSKSMALANYYLQQKIKEEMLYHHFQIEINQQSGLMAQAQQEQYSEEAKSSYDELFKEFDKFVMHKSLTYEGGMSWLKHYNSRDSEVSSNSKFPEKRKKYLLDSTLNAYILKPFLNNFFLYWRRFNTEILRGSKSGKVYELLNEHQKENGHYEKLQIKLIVHWENRRMEEEARISNDLMGCDFSEIAEAVQEMEQLQKRQRDMKYIHTRLYDGFREGLQRNIKAFFELAFPNQDVVQTDSLFVKYENDDPRRTLFSSQKYGDPLAQYFRQYELLLKQYQPDGLFREVNINYRSAFYQCKIEARYKLREEFMQIIHIYNVCRAQFTKLFDQDEIDRLIGVSKEKLFEVDKPLRQRFAELSGQERMVLCNRSQQIKSIIEENMSKEEQQYCQFLIFGDLKAILAAYCFSYSLKMRQ